MNTFAMSPEYKAGLLFITDKKMHRADNLPAFVSVKYPSHNKGIGMNNSFSFMF